MPGTRQDYFPAWDFARLALGVVSASNAAVIAGVNVGATSGVYWHATNDVVPGVGTVLAFDGGISWGAGTTVVFDAVTLRYTVSRASAFAMDFNGAQGAFFRRALGFRLTSYSGSSSYTSDMRPWYCIRAVLPSGASDSGIYEPDGRVYGGETEGGLWYGIAPKALAQWREWTVRAESYDGPTDAQWIADPSVAGAPLRQEVWSRVQWHWRAFFEHCRAHMPFANSVRGAGSTEEVYVLRPDGAHFRPRRMFEAYDGAWDIDFRARLLVENL